MQYSSDEEPSDQFTEELLPGARNGCVMFDRGTDFFACYPTATRTTAETEDSFAHWEGPPEAGRRVESFYADNAPELKEAAKKRKWHTPTSTPGVPPSNGLAERMVRRAKAGTISNLSQSGLTKAWWPLQ